MSKRPEPLYLIEPLYREILSELGIEYERNYHDKKLRKYYKLEVDDWVAATVEAQAGKPMSELRRELTSLQKNTEASRLVGSLFRLGGVGAVIDHARFTAFTQAG